MPQRLTKKALTAIGLLLAALVTAWLEQQPDGGAAPGDSQATLTTTGKVAKAFQERRSNLVLVDSGRVSKVLRDDLKGSRHQRFLVELEQGPRILIAHNIDLAPRVAGLEQGDSVRFKGEYEWTEKGGVVHWTHHDPRGRHPGGWIEHQGERYE